MSRAKKLNEKLSKYISEDYSVQDIKDALKTKKDTWLDLCLVAYPKDNKEAEVSFWTNDKTYSIKTTPDLSVISLVYKDNKIIDAEFVQDSDLALGDIVTKFVKQCPKDFNPKTIKLLLKWVKQ